MKAAFRPQPKINLPVLVEAPYPGEDEDTKKDLDMTHKIGKDDSGDEGEEQKEPITAYLNYLGRRIAANSRFIENYASLGGDRRKLCNGILMHELGHDQWFPQDLIAHLVISDQADMIFEEKGPTIYAQYIDIIDNVKGILTANGEGILEVYRCMEIHSQNILQKSEDRFAEIEDLHLNSKNYQGTQLPLPDGSFATVKGKNIVLPDGEKIDIEKAYQSAQEEIERERDTFRVGRLSRIYYGYQADDDIGTPIDDKLFVKFVGEKKVRQRDLNHYVRSLEKDGNTREQALEQIIADCKEKDTQNMFLDYLQEAFGGQDAKSLGRFLATDGAEVDLLERQLEKVESEYNLTDSEAKWQFLWDYKSDKFSFYDAYAEFLYTTPCMLDIQFIQENGNVFRNGGILDKESVDDHEMLINKYGRIVEDMIHFRPPQEGEGESGEGQGDGSPSKGKGKGKGGRPRPGHGTTNSPQYTNKQFRKTLQRAMKWYNRSRYNRLRKKAKEMGYQEPKKKPDSQKGIGVGGGDANWNDNIEYYAELARQMDIYIQKKPLEANKKDICPKGEVKYSMDDPYDRINPFSSGGIILPGVTSRFIDGARNRYVDQLRVPHCLILIDSSGSMDNPITGKSYAVLAGFSIALNYHRNESYIAALNFSGNTVGCDFTRDLLTVYDYIAMYQAGGTSVDLTKLEKILKTEDRKLLIKDKDNPTPEEVQRLYGKDALQKDLSIEVDDTFEERERGLEKLDIYVITDGGISNLPQTLDYLHALAQKARTHILHVGSWGGFSKENFPDNVSLYQIDKEQDIIGIQAGIMHQNFGGGSGDDLRAYMTHGTRGLYTR